MNFSISFVGHDDEHDKGIGIADLMLEKEKSLEKKKNKLYWAINGAWV